MRIFQRLRAALIVLLFLWTCLYLPLYFWRGAIPAPLSACQIPLLPIFFGVNAGYVVYAAFFLAALVSALLGAFRRFAGKLFAVLLPTLLVCLDVAGQIICYQAARFEQEEEGRLTAYYYFNDITPAPPAYFLVSALLDLLWLFLLLWPVIRPHLTRRKVPQSSDTEQGIVTDNWAEIFSAEAQRPDGERAMHEEHKKPEEKS